jgi:hypothetical protein
VVSIRLERNGVSLPERAAQAETLLA